MRVWCFGLAALAAVAAPVAAEERTTAGDAAGAGGFLAPGNIPIQIRVKASFRLVSTAEP